MNAREQVAADHRHYWQPGPMIAGWSSHATGDESTPNELVVLCGCGAVGRVIVPRKPTGIVPLRERRLRVVDDDEADR